MYTRANLHNCRSPILTRLTELRDIIATSKISQRKRGKRGESPCQYKYWGKEPL